MAIPFAKFYLISYSDSRGDYHLRDLYAGSRLPVICLFNPLSHCVPLKISGLDLMPNLSAPSALPTAFICVATPYKPI